jgi:hypothetical protein
MTLPKRDTTTRVLTGAEAIRESLAAEVEKAITVIRSIDDLTYCRVSNSTSSVGEQFRHDLDLVNTFLAGIAMGKIDYTRRERDSRVSMSRSYAIEKYEVALRKIRLLDRSIASGLVSVRSEVADSMWLMSSIAREMEFVLSHTIHHHALIAEKLAGFGIVADGALGVAPSTQKYRSRLAA